MTNSEDDVLPALGIEQGAATANIELPDPVTDGETEPGDASPEQPVKRRRRRKAKAAPVPDEAQALADARTREDLKHALGLTFGVTFDLIADARQCEFWRLAEPERDALGDAWATALAPYMGGLGKHMPMLSAVIVTAGVVIPRLKQDAQRATLRAAVAVPAAQVEPPAPAPERPPLGDGAITIMPRGQGRRK